MKRYFHTKIRPRLKHWQSSLGIARSRDKIGEIPPDFDELTRNVYKAVVPFTMTSAERIAALVEAVRYVVDNGIEGDFVECGVWRGGSSMAVALVLKELGDTSRELYLYDTYEGMSAPSDEDVDHRGRSARSKFEDRQLGEDSSEWCRSPIEEVTNNILSTGYPEDRIHLIKGKVEDTIPEHMPAGDLAILRLDTDWYESTRHEMKHLYPRLVSRGVLILDDYGHWEGVRRAVDEYFAAEKLRPLMNRVDYSCRLVIAD